jgi:hypothetical protein
VGDHLVEGFAGKEQVQGVEAFARNGARNGDVLVFR